MKKVKIISAGRSDYDRFYPIINSLNKSKIFKIYLYLTRDHYSQKYGNTFKYVDKKFRILKNKIKKFSKFKLDEFNDDLFNLSKNIKKIKPKAIIVMGDRYEMLLGPLISIPSKIPVIHFYGGAVTEGSSDELVRHAITKMSHFHFVAVNDYKKRLLQLGEENWRIKKIGVLSLEKIKKFKFLNKKELSKKLDFNFNSPYALMTYHPSTHELEIIEKTMYSIKKAAEINKIKLVITYPNSDLKNETVIKFIKKNFNNKINYKIIKNCGYSNFLNIAKNSEFLIGNSSAGIVEAASLKIPSINIGTRQDGKVKPLNVIDVKYGANEISKAIRKTKKQSFKQVLKNLKNPYEYNFTPDDVTKTIIRLIKRKNLLKKKFINI